MKPPPPDLPAWPAAAESALDPVALQRLAVLGELLATHGVERGLLGPREVPRLWERHLLNCAVLEPLIPADAAGLCDVGSGAGLPGLVLAALRPDLAVTVLEPLLRRTTFLTEAVDALGLTRVEVLRGRAEDWAGRRTWPVVTARAVAPLDRLAGWCLPLLTPGGLLLALKGVLRRGRGGRCQHGPGPSSAPSRRMFSNCRRPARRTRPSWSESVP